LNISNIYNFNIRSDFLFIKFNKKAAQLFKIAHGTHAASDSTPAASRSSCHQELHLTADARPDARLCHQAHQQRGIYFHDVSQLALLKSNKVHWKDRRPARFRSFDLRNMQSREIPARRTLARPVIENRKRKEDQDFLRPDANSDLMALITSSAHTIAL
jgi:hypothetical protein